MNINILKNYFLKDEINFIIQKLQKAEFLNFIVKKFENNPYLLCSYVGNPIINSKWYIKIYKTKDPNKFSISCSNFDILQYILNNLENNKIINYSFKSSLALIQVDDSGWGFPLCGVMIGVLSDQEIKTDIVDLKYFQGDNFIKKKYLDEYARLGINIILNFFNATPTTHHIEICTGYINTKLKEQLQKLGFVVNTTQIKGLLQTKLEEYYFEYVKNEIKNDANYNPMLFDISKFPKQFDKILEIGIKYFPHKLKTGWRSIQKLLNK